MKTIGLMLAAVFLSLIHTQAAAPPHEFIRKPGEYTLDKQGRTDFPTTLAITKDPAGQATLKLTCRYRDAHSSFTTTVEPNNALLAEGWFVFVEQPNRIWVFNGVASALLLTHSEKESVSKSHPGRSSPSAPKNSSTRSPNPSAPNTQKPHSSVPKKVAKKK